MNISQKVLDYTLLAELSYVNFRDVSLSKNNINSWQDEAKKDITDKDGREIILEKLLETYEIVDFQSFDAIGESDLQMMLLKDKSTGEYVISYRGTAGYHDAVITDLAQMGLKLDDNDQFKESLVVTNYWKELYGLNSSNTTLSGHSLGGALAQLNSYYYGFSAYTINAFGFDASVNGLYLSIDAYLTNQQILNNAVKNTDNIYNFIAEGGKFKDIIAGGLTDIVGQFENTHIGEVIILKDSTGGYLGFIGSHSSSDINNTLEIYHNLMEAFNLENNYNILTQIIDKYIVALNGNQMKRFLDDVSKILNISLPSDLKEFTESIKDRNLTINLVENINYEEIIGSNDKAKLYALINQIPFTISSSSVDLYEDFDISNMSQSELNDRGLMYEYIINNTPENQREYSFINNETKINLIDNSLKKPAIVFGNDTSERLYGKDTDDRIYAGKGDDTIIAGNGNDYIEGGLGNDTIEAGAGINYVDGGEGNDTVSYKTIQSKEGINVNLSLATAQAINSTTTDTLVNIENVIGTKYSDTIYGSSFDVTTLEGEKKIYILEGYDGSDKIYELFDLIDVGISSINLNTSLRDAIDTNITIDEAIEDVLEFKKLVA